MAVCSVTVLKVFLTTEPAVRSIFTVSMWMSSYLVIKAAVYICAPPEEPSEQRRVTG